MRISQEELNRRLGSKENLINVIPARGNDCNNKNDAGRKADIPNAPKSLRIVAGVLSKAEGNSAAVGRNLGISAPQARYAAGKRDVELTEKRVQEVALNRLMDALGLLDVDAISTEKPKEISSIAANLSRVHANLRPREINDGNQVQINIYSPKQKTLEDYQVIEVEKLTGT